MRFAINDIRVVVNMSVLYLLNVLMTVPLMEQALLTLPEHMRSPPGFRGVRVPRSLVCCVLFCRQLFLLLSFFHLTIAFQQFQEKQFVMHGSWWPSIHYLSLYRCQSKQPSVEPSQCLCFFRNACTKSGSLRFSQFSGC